jgi:MFS family permease
MVFGRFLIGLGAEALGIAANIFILKWFQGKELSFANALNLSLCRSASVLNTLLSPKIAEVR